MTSRENARCDAGGGIVRNSLAHLEVATTHFEGKGLAPAWILYVELRGGRRCIGSMKGL